MSEVLSVRFARDGCWIEATNRDPETRGVINDVENLAADRRRVPRWIPRWLRPRSAKWSDRILAAVLPVAIILIAGVLIALGVLGQFVWTVTNGNEHLNNETALVVVLIAAGLVLLTEVPYVARSATVLLTASRSEAPTFLRRGGGDILIAVIVAAAFYILGALTARLYRSYEPFRV